MGIEHRRTAGHSFGLQHEPPENYGGACGMPPVRGIPLCPVGHTGDETLLHTIRGSSLSDYAHETGRSGVLGPRFFALGIKTSTRQSSTKTTQVGGGEPKPSENTRGTTSKKRPVTPPRPRMPRAMGSRTPRATWPTVVVGER